MSETKFTPGPWGLDKAVEVWVMAGPLHVATIPRAGDGDWSPANAHLIAAAPDLYEALEDLAAQVGKMPSDTGGNMGRMVASLCGAKMALDKARGKS